MTWQRLFSTCWFSHDRDPVRVLIKGVLHFECAACGADLGVVLAGQRYKARKVKVRKRKSADVLTLERRKVS